MRAGVSCGRAIGVVVVALAVGGATAHAQRLDWTRRVWSGPDREDPLSAYRSASAPAVVALAGGGAIVAVKGGVPSRNSFDPLWQVLRLDALAVPTSEPTWELAGDVLGGPRPFGVPAALAVDGAGDVVVAGTATKRRATGAPCCGYELAVVKLRGDGRLAWQRRVRPEADVGFAGSVAVDGAGDVVAAGFVADGAQPRLVVAKHGADGEPRWLYELDPGVRSAARTVTVDAAGHVVVAGYRGGEDADLVVVKLDGADGRELWRAVLDGTAPARQEARLRRGLAFAIARQTLAETFLSTAHRMLVADDVDVPEGADAVVVDRAGDVVVSGAVMTAGRSRDFAVAKLDGASGSVRWMQTLDGGGRALDRAFALTLDSRDDVVAAGYLRRRRRTRQTAAAFVKLDGTTGAVRWQRSVYGTAPRTASINRIFAVTVDGADDVLGTGFFTNVVTARDAMLVKLSGLDGAERWRVKLTPSIDVIERFTDDVGLDVELGEPGTVLASGVDGTGAAFLSRVTDGVAGGEARAR
jgi:outer membrane protein assembly factor BamB